MLFHNILFKLIHLYVFIQVEDILFKSSYAAISSFHHMSHFVTNNTLSGIDIGCEFSTNYFTTPHVSFPMCIGQTNQDLKNGMSIINLISSRGYLPTCRVMHLMLWMASQVEDGSLARDTFLDIGANIGSCSVHIASLGFPVIAVEPVQQHVDTIRGSASINPYFHLEVHHLGISGQEKLVRVNFGHGARNWGASEFHEVDNNSTFELELPLKTVDQVIGHRRMSLVKIDCEGCEWDALKGAKKSIRRIPMFKIELVQNEYTSGNETVSPHHIIEFLHNNNFDLYIDHWNEQSLYFGNHGNEIYPIDKLFGSKKFNLLSNLTHLDDAARLILENPIDVLNFNHKGFLKQFTDVIVIERTLSQKMKKYWNIN